MGTSIAIRAGKVLLALRRLATGCGSCCGGWYRADRCVVVTECSIPPNVPVYVKSSSFIDCGGVRPVQVGDTFILSPGQCYTISAEKVAEGDIPPSSVKITAPEANPLDCRSGCLHPDCAIPTQGNYYIGDPCPGDTRDYSGPRPLISCKAARRAFQCFGTCIVISFGGKCWKFTPESNVADGPPDLNDYPNCASVPGSTFPGGCCQCLSDTWAESGCFSQWFDDGIHDPERICCPGAPRDYQLSAYGTITEVSPFSPQAKYTWFASGAYTEYGPPVEGYNRVEYPDGQVFINPYTIANGGCIPSCIEPPFSSGWQEVTEDTTTVGKYFCRRKFKANSYIFYGTPQQQLYAVYEWESEATMVSKVPVKCGCGGIGFTFSGTIGDPLVPVGTDGFL